MSVKNIILCDNECREQLFPLTLTRPIGDLRVGILTLKEKWEKYILATVSFKTESYLQGKFQIERSNSENIWINASVLPAKGLVENIMYLGQDQGICYNNIVIAINSMNQEIKSFKKEDYPSIQFKVCNEEITCLSHPWDIIKNNESELKKDFELLTKGRISQKIPEGIFVSGEENLFIEEGAIINPSFINATDGPVYIGGGAQVMDGAMLRGPIALCEKSTLKMGAKIYGATTIGPHCKVGGEVSHSILHSHTNKAHDGFLGESVLGEWVNLGADTNNSNLKNNYAEVKMWSYPEAQFIRTGMQFCGLVMGDHSKCGINTMFNTGTVVGVSANIFGSGFPRNFVPSFSWGGKQGFEEYKLERVYATIRTVMARREKKFDEREKQIIDKVFQLTAKYRNF